MTYQIIEIDGARMGTLVSKSRFELPRRRSKRVFPKAPVIIGFIGAVLVFGVNQLLTH